MVGQNDDFLEEYKHLDKICREIFNNEKGITTYINEMETKRNGAFYISSWNITLHKLKEYRRIRNIYVHEVGTRISDICTIEDIHWLNNFYEDIMQTKDPLAQYRKLTTQQGNKSVMESKDIEKALMTQVTPSKKSESRNIGLFLVIFAAIGIAGFCLSIFLFIFLFYN